MTRPSEGALPPLLLVEDDPDLGPLMRDVLGEDYAVTLLPDGDAGLAAALRCDFEGRLLAGFRKGEDLEAARRPQTGTAWLGEAAPGRPVIPVRIDSVSRWFGTVTARLASFGPPGQVQARAGN